MKELSIEEKAKAYDEAIKRAQAKMEEAKVFDYDDEQTAHTIRLTTTDIFPELKESEDERIRKRIINVLKAVYECADIPFISQKQTLDSYVAYLERQGEQKPADTEKGANGNDREIPNSAWSEEDEKMLNDILMCGERHCYLDAGNIAWLVFLKDRVQPKQEWSEDDCIRLQRIIDFLWYNRKGDTDTIYQQEQDINWLKSLKYRYTWKPSDEQLEALDSATENCAYSEYQDCLRELMGQLKKTKITKL